MRFLAGLFFLIVFLLPSAEVQAQREGVLQIDSPLSRFLLNAQAAGLLPGAHLSQQPLSAYAARAYLDSLDARRGDLPVRARLKLDRLLGRSDDPNVDYVRGLAPFLYRNGASFFSVEQEDYGLEINPILYLTYGPVRQTARDGREAWTNTWWNTRGLRAAGHIGRYIFFDAQVEETQRRDVRPAFSKKTAPRLPYVRFHRSNSVYDYQVATGVVGLRTKHFEVRVGRERNRWGPGIGSMLLSNYAPAYDQIQIRTSFWRIQYTNLFAALTDLTTLPPSFRDQILPRKYAALHRLEIDLPARVQVGFTESIIFGTDTTGMQRRTGFDLSYLNPVIFYRAAEADRGSPDNYLLGVDAAWTATPGLRLYTQLLLDELTISKAGKGYWGNKWGWLAGAHVYVPEADLSLRLEYARLRPYLYSHRWPVTAYTQFDDALGHPAGPNAEDVALFAEFSPSHRFHFAFDAAYTWRGRNTDELNYGSDPRLSYNTRVSDMDVRILQGVRQDAFLFEGRATYEVLPDFNVGGALLAHSLRDAETGLDRYVAPTLLVQWGVPFQSRRY